METVHAALVVLMCAGGVGCRRAPRVDATPVATADPASSATPKVSPAPRWIAMGRLPFEERGFALATFGSKTFAIGGWAKDSRSVRTHVFDATTSGGWSDGAPLPAPRGGGKPIVLENGDILFTKGELLDDEPAIWFSAASGKWSTLKSPFSTVGMSAVALEDGRILFTGGNSYRYCLSGAGVFDPKTGAWKKVPFLPRPQFSHALLVAGDHKVYLLGGQCWNDGGGHMIEGGGSLFPTAVFDPKTNTWGSAPAGPLERTWATYTRLLDGRLLVSGGEPEKLYDGALRGEDLDALERLALYTPGIGWKKGPKLAFPRSKHATILLADGRVMLIGGRVGTSTVTTVEVFDPRTEKVVPAPSLPVPIEEPVAARVGDDRVCVFAGYQDSTPIDEAYCFAE